MPSRQQGPSEQSETTPSRERPLLLDRPLLIVFSLTLIGVMGVSSIAPALPAIAREYGITIQQVGWLIAVFTLPGIVLTPVAGLLADRYGRKRILLPSLVLFAIAGSACALADGFGQLLVLRALQGTGSAALGALYPTLIADAYSGNRRATAMGYVSGVISAAAAAYPVIGGAIALFGWRYAFTLALLAVPAALFVGFGFEGPEVRHSTGFRTYLRNLAITVGNRRIAAMYFSSLAGFVLLYGPLVTFLPFLLEDRFGASSAEVGLVLAGSAGGSAVASFFLGAMVRRIPHRAIALWGLTLMSVPIAVMPFSPEVWLIVVAAAVFGGSHGVSLSIVQLLLTEHAPAEQRGAVMALNAMMFRLGQTFGPLMGGVILTFGGMNAVFVGTAVFGGLSVIFLGMSMPRERRG